MSKILGAILKFLGATATKKADKTELDRIFGMNGFDNVYTKSSCVMY